MANFNYFGTNNSLGKDVLYERLVGKSSGAIAIDVETVGLDDRRLIGIGFSITPTDNYYFPWDSAMLPLGLLKNPNVTKVIHNGHFDLQVIKEDRGNIYCVIELNDYLSDLKLKKSKDY